MPSVALLLLRSLFSFTVAFICIGLTCAWSEKCNDVETTKCSLEKDQRTYYVWTKSIITTQKCTNAHDSRAKTRIKAHKSAQKRTKPQNAKCDTTATQQASSKWLTCASSAKSWPVCGRLSTCSAIFCACSLSASIISCSVTLEPRDLGWDFCDATSDWLSVLSNGVTSCSASASSSWVGVSTYAMITLYCSNYTHL